MLTFLRRLFRPRPSPIVLALEQAQSSFLATIDTIAASHASILQSVHSMVAHQADASKAQSEAFSTFLQSFQVAAPPIARTMRDEDEVKAELERKGFPTTGTPEQQLQWVLKNSDGQLDVDDLMRASL